LFEKYGAWTFLSASPPPTDSPQIDHNRIENAIRPLKLGAKNYMFFGSRRGGELACAAHTLIENCKRHELDLRTS